MRSSTQWAGLVTIVSASVVACGDSDERASNDGHAASGGQASSQGSGGGPGPGGSPGSGGNPGSGGETGSGGQGGAGLPPGEPVGPITLPAEDLSAFRALQQEVASASELDREGLLAAYPTSLRTDLGYDPRVSQHLDLIQGSALALNDAELTTLGGSGFVISKRRQFPTFLRGLAEIYSEDLPLYVSADTILESIHSSFDGILLNVEAVALIPSLRSLLVGMRERLAASDDAARPDTDLYLAVALSLLDGQPVPPVAGADSAKVEELVGKAAAASGIAQVELFGVPREEDFSQFLPRGHYTGDSAMEQYFRAMMWLGRVDLRLMETQADGTQVFRRPQFLATLLLHELIGPDLALWQSIDDTIRTFVGESDYMVVPEVASLVADLGGISQARAASNEAVARAIAQGGYGKQQIASHLMVNGGAVGTLPLNRSFAVFGQRYVVDSHVFSETVYDRLPGKRMMPTPLDAAFAALGNNQALTLHPELNTFPALPGALGRMRVLVDAHDDAFFGANFYNLWLNGLRSLSPTAELADPGAAGLPSVASTPAWGLRILNTQLASWAELRHDTLLYAKQSYTGIPVCEYPDAYVEPYPRFWSAVTRYAESGSRIVDIATRADAELGARVGAYFAALREASSTLLSMSEHQRRGEAFTAEQMAFINDAVRVDHESAGCVTVEVPNGWYARLFYGQAERSLEFDPTIADVHTQPADEAGTIVGRVLHVGTGFPRMMVTTVNTCEGPKAYAGVVFAYHETITNGFERLTDESWASQLNAGSPRPADVPWLSPVLAE